MAKRKSSQKKMGINLKELSDKSGESEVEIAKRIITLLAMKAEITGITQKVRLSYSPSK